MGAAVPQDPMWARGGPGSPWMCGTHPNCRGLVRSCPWQPLGAQPSPGSPAKIYGGYVCRGQVPSQTLARGGRWAGWLPPPALQMPHVGAGSCAWAGDKLLHLAPVTCHAGERS